MKCSDADEPSVEKTKLLLYTRRMVDVKKETAAFGAGIDLKAAQASQSPSFSLAHLSDLHLTTLANVPISQLLNKRILGYFSWRHKRRIVHRADVIEALLRDLSLNQPDHIAVTGDLTHLGLPMEYAEVSRWLPLLGDPRQATVIPGNHEAYVGNSWLKSCALWSPYLESDRDRPSSGREMSFPSLRSRGQIALIGLCSARPSLPFLAIGSLGKEQLVKFESLLQQAAAEGLFRVVLIHHPPVSGVVNWRKRLTDSRQFSAILKQHGADLVLHGHAHAPVLSELPIPGGRQIPVVGAASASEVNPWTRSVASYNIYRIARTNSGWRLTMTVRGYSLDQRRFVFEEERVLVSGQAG
jgi:3',5'-cyclic AMP phosphodiesterase CpdA